MSLKFEDLKGVDLHKYVICPAQVAICQSLPDANEIANAAASQMPDSPTRSIFIHAIGNWAVILFRDVEGGPEGGTKHSS